MGPAPTWQSLAEYVFREVESFGCADYLATPMHLAWRAWCCLIDDFYALGALVGLTPVISGNVSLQISSKHVALRAVAYPPWARGLKEVRQ